MVNAKYRNNDDLDMRYKSWSLNMKINGHTTQINIAPSSTMEIKGEKYYLMQFHLHADSEHTVNGDHEPVEIHFVHMNRKGELAVLGVFVEEDNKDKPIQKSPPFWNWLLMKSGQTTSPTMPSKLPIYYPANP